MEILKYGKAICYSGYRKGQSPKTVAPTKEQIAEDLDFVVNTAPAPVISDALLKKLRPGTLLLELASSPGFDRDRAQTLGLRPLYAPGLPGQFAPESAAALYWDTVGAILREKEENDGT